MARTTGHSQEEEEVRRELALESQLGTGPCFQPLASRLPENTCPSVLLSSLGTKIFRRSRSLCKIVDVCIEPTRTLQYTLNSCSGSNDKETKSAHECYRHIFPPNTFCLNPQNQKKQVNCNSFSPPFHPSNPPPRPSHAGDGIPGLMHARASALLLSRTPAQPYYKSREPVYPAGEVLIRLNTTGRLLDRLPPFYRGETEAQRSQAICPRPPATAWQG
jgi:hypothetical protein